MFKEILFVSKASDQAVKLFNITYLSFTKSDLVLSGIRKPEEYKLLDRSSAESECAFYNLIDKSSISSGAINIITNRESRNNIDVYLDKQSTIFGLGEKHVLDYTMVDLQKDLAEQEAYEERPKPASVKIDVRIKTPEFVKINTEIKRKWDEVVPGIKSTKIDKDWVTTIPDYVKRSDDVITMLSELDATDINNLITGPNGKKPYSINIPLTESTNNTYANAIDHSKPLDMSFNDFEFKPLYSFFQSVVERSEKEKEHREILNSALKEMHDSKDKNMRNEINISVKDDKFYIGVKENNPTVRVHNSHAIEDLKYCNMYLLLKEPISSKEPGVVTKHLNKLASESGLPIQSFLSSNITINYFIEEATARSLMEKLNVNEKSFRLVNEIVHVLVDKYKTTYNVNVNSMRSYANIQNDPLDLVFIYTDQLTQKNKGIYKDIDKMSKMLYTTGQGETFKDMLVTFVPVITESFVKTDVCSFNYPSLHEFLSSVDIDKCTDTLEKMVKDNNTKKVHSPAQDFTIKFDTELDKEICDEIAAACGLVKSTIPPTVKSIWEEYENNNKNCIGKPNIRVLDSDTSLVVKAKTIEDLNTALSKINNGIELWTFTNGNKNDFTKACYDYLTREGYLESVGSIFLVSLAFSEKYLKDVEGDLSLVYLRENKNEVKTDGYTSSFYTGDGKIGGKLYGNPISDKVKVTVSEDDKMMYIHYDNDDKLSEVRFGKDELVDYDKYVYHADNVISHIENYRDGKKIGTAYLGIESETTAEGETPYEKIVADDLFNGKYFWTLTNKRFEYNDKGINDSGKINKSFHNKSYWILFKDKYESVYNTVIKEMGSKFTCNEKPEYILISYKAAQNAKYGLEKLLPELSILNGNDIIKYYEEMIPENETN